jgi:GNAT superfamily N-acetyltransferase
MDKIEFAGYVPGALGRVVELHGSYYDKHWQMGLFFEAKAAREMADFLLNFNPACDGFWTALVDGQVIGSVSIVGKNPEEEGARLRWFILAEESQGRGIGKKLLELALDFCRKAGFKRVYLTTFAGLDAARYLYEQQGFKLYEEEEDTHWGKVTIEQKFELWL